MIGNIVKAAAIEVTKGTPVGAYLSARDRLGSQYEMNLSLLAFSQICHMFGSLILSLQDETISPIEMPPCTIVRPDPKDLPFPNIGIQKKELTLSTPVSGKPFKIARFSLTEGKEPKTTELKGMPIVLELGLGISWSQLLLGQSIREELKEAGELEGNESVIEQFLNHGAKEVIAIPQAGIAENAGYPIGLKDPFSIMQEDFLPSFEDFLIKTYGVYSKIGWLGHSEGARNTTTRISAVKLSKNPHLNRLYENNRVVCCGHPNINFMDSVPDMLSLLTPLLKKWGVTYLDYQGLGKLVAMLKLEPNLINSPLNIGLLFLEKTFNKENDPTGEKKARAVKIIKEFFQHAAWPIPINMMIRYANAAHSKVFYGVKNLPWVSLPDLRRLDLSMIDDGLGSNLKLEDYIATQPEDIRQQVQRRFIDRNNLPDTGLTGLSAPWTVLRMHGTHLEQVVPGTPAYPFIMKTIIEFMAA